MCEWTVSFEEKKSASEEFRIQGRMSEGLSLMHFQKQSQTTFVSRVKTKLGPGFRMVCSTIGSWNFALTWPIYGINAQVGFQGECHHPKTSGEKVCFKKSCNIHEVKMSDRLQDCNLFHSMSPVIIISLCTQINQERFQDDFFLRKLLLDKLYTFHFLNKLKCFKQ